MYRRTDVKSKSRMIFAGFNSDFVIKYNTDDHNDSFNRFNSNNGKNGQVSQNISKDHGDRKFQRDSLTESGYLNQKEVMFKVDVKGCGQCSSHEIITEIQGYTIPFIPFFPFRTDKGDISFLVKDSTVAMSLQQLSRRVTNPRTSTNLFILIKKKTCSFNRLPVDLKNLIEIVCEGRLTDDKKTLDLSNFSSDPLFKSKGIIVSLQRVEVCNAVIEFIFNKCSEAVRLSLKNTGLRDLYAISSMVYAVPMLKILDLSCNFIDNVSELSRIRTWKIEELFLENTGISNLFTKTSEYSRAIREYFPYLKTLDGIPVKVNNWAPVLNNNKEVIIKPSFFPSKDIETFLKMFVAQYYDIFDGPNGITTRKQLSEAYDENAIFSHVFEAINDGNQDRVSKSLEILRGPIYKLHKKSSHNILLEHAFAFRRDETYGKGILEILAMLCRLPPTEHIRESFVMDVCMITSKVVIFTIQGLFNDGEEYFASSKLKTNLKYFTRSFVCQPKGGSALSIVSDILTIHPIDQECTSKYEKYCMDLKNMQLTSTVASEISNCQTNMENIPIVEGAFTSSINKNNVEVQNAMVRSFMEQSGMNEIWSRHCLEESDWNFSLAGDRFLSVRDSIPAEAFKK
uniref:NTF2 domain-containing protein n=1 Tax=Strongyloides papillosus TaxID=174720 RepID=A0A0N5BKA9_STREA